MLTVSRHEQKWKYVHDKKWENSAEANVSPLCTDNSYPTPLSDSPFSNCINYTDQSPQLSALVVNCQS